MRYIVIVLGLFSCLAFAQEADTSLYNRQKAVLSALDSIEENVIGFALNGRAKGGVLSSTLSSEALPDNKDVSEHSAFSDFLLNISVRPSNETKATFDLRFHKDWQSAYREGNNSPIVRWWSYDGNILDKKLKFNLGTMRVAYTPLTIYLPEPDLILEPEIFSNLRKDAMEERYLDGTNRRLLQGLNVEYKSPVGIFDNIFLQGTIVRLRKTANQSDREFHDFDPYRDRYSTAARIGMETYGFSFAISDIYTFDRFGSSTKSLVVDYEKNNVLSFELGYNGKKLLSGPVNFSVGAEFALSDWKHYKYAETTIRDTVLNIRHDINIPSYTSPGSSSNPADKNGYPSYQIVERDKLELFKVNSFNNQAALLANASITFNQRPFEAKLSGHFLNVDEYFEAELAASPAYLPNLPILNSNANLNSALEQFRTSSLENMYYSLYYSLPMNALTMIAMNGASGGLEEVIGGYNNYKFSHYYRNAYTQQTYTRLERESVVSSRLDPAVNLALPYGYATPDRTGGGADLSFTLNNVINLRGVFGMYSSKNSDYTRFGGGIEVDAARLAGLNKALVISGSYEHSKEENGQFNPQANRLMAGVKAGIWRGLSIVGGFQQLDKEFEKTIKIGETLIIGGPQIKISERANFSLQSGFLSNSISAKDTEGNKLELDLDKHITSAIVTVEF
ncbi:MAG: hypothetical protein LBC85_07820 [Fibromonadaceae bacterium]|jgi:hypothetical protein|nr:hypothetical protein [Fibromonadaceae bacterium]